MLKIDTTRHHNEMALMGLELLTHSYLSALKIMSEGSGRDVRTLRDAWGARISVAREGIDNVHRDYQYIKENLPTDYYFSLHELADRMYTELNEVVVEDKSR